MNYLKIKTIKNGLFSVLLMATTFAQADITTTYYINDALGSPIVEMDETGEVTWRKNYKPFGEEIEQGSDSANNRIGYTGHVHDRDIGLTYMQGRYYDPMVGRFMGIDPAAVKPEDPRTFNRYAYANNNPYGFVDPDGRVAAPIIWGIGVLLTVADMASNDPIPGHEQDGIASVATVPGPVKFGGSIVKGGGTETVQRWMSKAELKATQKTKLLRGGRDGTHYVTDSANSTAKRARQRSALPKTPEVKVTLEVPAGKFSQPTRVEPAFNMPGGGMERTATGNIPVAIKRVK